MSLCDVCQAILHSFEAAASRDLLGETAQRLEDRSAQGCRLCSLFLGTTGGYPSARAWDDIQQFYKEHRDRGEIVIKYSKSRASLDYLDAILCVDCDGPEFANRLQLMLAILKPTGVLLQYPFQVHRLKNV
jgi:hypothetical protein